MPVFRWSELEEKLLYPDHCKATGSVFKGEKIAAVRVRYPAASEVKPHATRREQIPGDRERAIGPSRRRIDRRRPHRRRRRGAACLPCRFGSCVSHCAPGN